MSDYFRVMRGIEIDEKIRIFQGENEPGATIDAENAPVGSMYADTVSGELYVKRTTGAGNVSWRKLDSSVGTNPQLYSEYIDNPLMPLARGSNSIAIGSGAATDTTATSSIALGQQSLARYPGSQVFSAGSFLTIGDAQTGKYLLRTYTTNSTPTEAFLDGKDGSMRLVLPDNSTWTYNATIVGHCIDESSSHAGYTISGVICNIGATNVTFIGRPIKHTLAETDTSWEVSVSANVGTRSLSFIVRGQDEQNVKWLVLVETVEIAN